VTGHPALQELECHQLEGAGQDADAWLSAACSVPGLVRLSLYPGRVYEGDDFAPVTVAPDAFMTGVFGHAMRLPLQLRSLSLTLDSASFTRRPRMQPLLGALAGALGDRLTELSVCVRYQWGEHAPDAPLCLPMFVRLERITLGTWAPFDARQPHRLAKFRALQTRFRSVRAGMPALRAATFELAYLEARPRTMTPAKTPFEPCAAITQTFVSWSNTITFKKSRGCLLLACF
jgi:hypothetical protein